MQNQQQKILQTQEQTLSGNRTNRPSDDPAGVYRHVLFSADLTGVQSLKKTTQFASERLASADGYLNQVHDRMLETQDLILKMSNSSVGGNPQIMKATAEEAKASYADVLKSANAQLDEVPLFGGGRTRSPFSEENLAATHVRVRANGTGSFVDAPAGITARVDPGSVVKDLPVSVKVTYLGATGQYEVDVNGIKQGPIAPSGEKPPVVDVGQGIKMTMGADPKPGDAFYFEVVPSYQGGGEDRAVRVLNGRTLPGNVTGGELLEGTGATGRGVNVFGALAAVRGALLRADPSEVAAQLDRVQQGRAQVSDLQSITGVRAVQVDAVNKTLELDESSLQISKATNVEADLTQVLSNLEKSTQAMQVMTISERQILNTSLLDFIR